MENLDGLMSSLLSSKGTALGKGRVARVVVQFDYHPEQAFSAQRKLALSGVEGDLGEPREGGVFFATQSSRVGLASLSNRNHSRLFGTAHGPHLTLNSRNRTLP